jgi:hypothetical protein
MPQSFSGGDWYNFGNSHRLMAGRNLSIIEKIPKLEDIAPVYAVIVMMIYPWTLSRFFWKLSSWILFASVGDLTAYFAYMVVVNLLESILVLLVPILMSIILPQSWFYNRFKTRSVALALFGLGFLIYLDKKLYADSPFPLTLVRWIPAAGVAILLLVFLVDRVGFLRRLLEELANRLTIFLYISIPISVVSLLVILIRNVF